MKVNLVKLIKFHTQENYISVCSFINYSSSCVSSKCNILMPCFNIDYLINVCYVIFINYFVLELYILFARYMHSLTLSNKTICTILKYLYYILKLNNKNFRPFNTGLKKFFFWC